MIKNKKKGNNNGFFLELEFPDKYNILPVLLTDSFIFEDKNNINDNKVEFILNNKSYEIIMDNSRKVFIDDEYNISIIEIKYSDGLNINSFIRTNIYNINSAYKNIYSMFYTSEGKLECHFGKILKYNDNNFEVQFLAGVNILEGSPIIINFFNNIIGVVKSIKHDGNIVICQIINTPINKFIKEDSQYKSEINDKNIEGIDEITIKYKYSTLYLNGFNSVFGQELSPLKLFGEYFVETNKKICKMIYKEKIYELSSFIKEIKTSDMKEGIEIKLKDINKVNNLSYMFCGCTSLSSLPDIDKINTCNVSNLSCMFCGCSNLSLPDISKWDTKKVTNISAMFYKCELLNSLPDISKWNTDNIQNINGLFCGCSFLQSLPDISKWNINKVNNLSLIFCNCSSLESLPDLSKWDISNVYDISYLFSNCIFLKSLPNISNWNTKNVTNMNNLFDSCQTLITLPDISNWDTSNVTDFSKMFNSCISIKLLPDISNWNLNSAENMERMFCSCRSLISLPDISKWNIQNNKNITALFSHCTSLISLPDISKWDVHGKIIDYLLSNCSSLISLPDISN